MFGENALVKAALLLTPLLVAPSVPAEADEYVCTPAKVVECDSDLNCGLPAPQLLPPTFFHVDLDDRVITLLGPADRRGETTQIRHMERDGDRVIMGGVQAGRAWSMILAESEGRMTLTVNLGDAGWVIFGQCIPADQLSP
jgi:hypothetical protein